MMSLRSERMDVMSNQDKIKSALKSIDDSLQTINTNEDWISYLKFQSLFYNYSFGNAILIYAQSGGQATYVKGYKSWNKLGRYVKKGAKGLAILAPCFRRLSSSKNRIIKMSTMMSRERKRSSVLSVVSG